MYRDGDADLPTICGTGLEDYVGSAWGLGRCHSTLSGAPLVVHPGSGAGGGPLAGQPRLRRLLPLAPPGPDHVQRRPARDHPADRREVLRGRSGGRARGLRSRRTRSPARAGTAGSRRGCWPGASPNGSTTTARRRTCTAPRSKRCRASTSPPRPPTSTRRDYESADPFELVRRHGGLDVGLSDQPASSSAASRSSTWRLCRAAIVRNISSPRSVRSTSIDAATAMISPAKVPRR